MTSPAIYLGFLIAIACGLGFHLLRGGGRGRLLLYVGAAVISFFVGHAMGNWLEWHLLRIGTLNLFSALLSTGIGLTLATFIVGDEDPAERATMPLQESKTRKTDSSDEP